MKINQPLKIILIVLLGLIFVVPIQSQTNKKPDSPKIGLVLSGGGARGFAHIGVIKVLEEEGIDVDIIGGTSMGSIVGGLYAMGYSIYEIENMALHQDWDYILNDKIKRKDLGFYEKDTDERSVLSLALSGRKISIPPGLVYGQNTMDLLTKLTDPSFQSKDFSDLDKPFFCMAADLLSGTAIKLDTGNLALAIRASMSVPSAFAPVAYGPYYLVDGGVINNYPAEYVKKLGADYLIGIDIQTPMYEKDEIDNLLKVLSQSIFLNGKEEYERNLKLIDFDIKPELEPFSALDFDRADSLIARGEAEARAIVPQLREFLDSIGYQKKAVRGEYNTFPQMDVLYVDHVVFKGNKKISNQYLSQKLDISSGDQISMIDLDKRIDQLYGTKLFHTVYYELDYTQQGQTMISVFVEEASLFDINVGAHYNDYSKAGLLLNLTSRNLGVPNGRLSVDIVLGKVSKYYSEYIVDNGLTPGFGVNIDAFTQYGYQYQDEKKVLSFDMGIIRHQGFGLMTFKNIMRLRMGYELELNVISQDVSFIEFDEFSNFSANVFADFKIDTYDRAYFPSKGLQLYGKWEFGQGENTNVNQISDDEVEYDKVDYNFSSIIAKISGVTRFNKNFSMIPSFYFRKVYGEDVLFSKLSYLGGFQKTYIDSYIPFPGYDFMELEAHTLFYPSFDFRYNFFKDHYVCFEANILSVNLDLDKTLGENDFYTGWKFGYTYYSVFGPITISMAQAYPKSKMFYDINIGFWF